MKYYGDIDLNQNRLLNTVIDQGDDFPSGPTTGQLFYLWPTNSYSIDDGLYIYEGPSSAGDQSERPRDWDDTHTGNYDGAPYEEGYQGWVKAGALTNDEISAIVQDVTLDQAYDNETGNRIITVDNGSVEWQLTDNYEFNIADSTGSDIFSVKALGAGDTVEINGDLDVNGGSITLDADSASNFTVDGANLTLSTTTSGDVILTSVGELTFQDQYLSAAIPISETGETGLDAGFSAISIVGALNELYSLSGTADTLDETYDAETGNRIITMDNGSVEWQISDGYEHNFADSAGNDILSVKALGGGDEVEINGALLDINSSSIDADTTDGFSFVDDSGAEVSADAAGAITITAAAGQNAVITTSGAGETQLASASQIDITSTDTGADAIDINSSGGIDIDVADDVAIDGANVTVGADITLYDDGSADDGWVEAKAFRGTDAGATSELAGNLLVQGDLTVNGTTTTLDTQTVLVEDNIIVLNNNEVGPGVSSGYSGIEIDRGSSDSEWFVFTESDDRWHVGFDAESGPPEAPAVMAVRVQRTFAATIDASNWINDSGNVYYVDFVYEDEGQSSSAGDTSQMLHTTDVEVKIYEENAADDYDEIEVERVRVFFDAGNSSKATARVYARLKGNNPFAGKVVVVG